MNDNDIVSSSLKTRQNAWPKRFTFSVFQKYLAVYEKARVPTLLFSYIINYTNVRLMKNRTGQTSFHIVLKSRNLFNCVSKPAQHLNLVKAIETGLGAINFKVLVIIIIT